MSGKFVVSKRKNGEFQFVLVASNGQVILTSEGYTARDGCLNGIESVRKNSADDARYERKTAKDNSPYFVLKAANHQIIGNSQMYSSEAARDNGIDSVRRHAPEAKLVEE